MKQAKLAAQLYTVRDYTQTVAAFQESCRRLQGIGYTAVQLSAVGPIAPEVIRDTLDEFGLTACITHVPFSRLQDDLTAVVAEHQLWKCPHVGLGSMPNAFRDSGADGYHRFAEIANEIGRRLHEDGLSFSYHNHSFEFARFDGQTGLDILFAETDPRYLWAILDTYWIQHGGGDPSAWIDKLAGRMAAIHVKDMVIQDKQQMMAEVGEGNLNWDSIMNACDKASIPWIAVEQDICQRDPFDSLAMSYDFLKTRGYS